MSDEPLALSTVPLAPPASADYDAICATVMESSRGRWFLQEFARRNRNADTSLVLHAIERIERVIRGDRGQQAYQDFRVELLEMAKTIAVTRAEVAEIGPEPVRAQAPAAAAPPASDAFAAAERIQEVAWTMRERGLDPSTCDQIEALASSILSASALRDPNDRRARKLAEVLQHLERRINAMLDSSADSVPTGTAEVEAKSETMPVVSEAERQSATSALPAQDLEAETVHVAEPEQPAAPAPAPTQIGNSAHAWAAAALEPVDTAEPASAPEPPQAPAEPRFHALDAVAVAEAPASEFAIALATELADPAALASAAAETEQQPVPQPSAVAEPTELELAPLVVVPTGQPTAAEDAPVTELELAPLIPARIGEPPSDRDTPVGIGLASEAPAGGHPEPIALELEPIAVSAAPTDEEANVLDAAAVTESTPPDTGGSDQPETLAIAELPAETAGDLPQTVSAVLAATGEGVEAANETTAAEFTDFLLEPLALPVTAGTATAGETGRETPEEPVQKPFDVMSEIEEELFAALPIEETVPGLSPPSPDAAQPAFAPAVAVPPSATTAAPLAMAEVAQAADGAPQATTPIGTATAVPARTAAKPMPRPAPNDPLAALKAMSDEERIALFT
jgi:hypothetical protein